MTVTRIARACGVTQGTIRYHIRKGHLRARKTGEGIGCLYTISDAEARRFIEAFPALKRYGGNALNAVGKRERPKREKDDAESD